MLDLFFSHRPTNVIMWVRWICITCIYIAIMRRWEGLTFYGLVFSSVEVPAGFCLVMAILLYLNIFLLVFCEPFWDIATWERFQALCCKRPRYLSAVWAFNLLFRLHIIPFYPVCFGCNVFIKRQFWWP